MEEKPIELNKFGRPKKPRGGAQPKAGRPKGSTNGIKISDLKQAIIDECDVSFEVMIAKTCKILYRDFIEGIERDNWIRYSNNIAKYVIQVPTQEFKVETSSDLSDDEVDKRIKTFLKTGSWVSEKKEPKVD